MATRTVLIVDENRDRARELGRVLAAPDRRIGCVTTMAEALQQVRDRTVDVIVTGLEFPSDAVSGLAVIRACRDASQYVRVIVLSGPATMDRAAEMLRAGAADVLGMPVAPTAIAAAVARALGGASGAADHSDGAGLLAGRAPAMLHLQKQVAQAAPSTAPVLIVGESGTGKHRVARALHAQGPRASGPFLTLNCAALPDAQAEAACFGQADGDTPGLFLQASGGTVLLDNISELSGDMQGRILQVLQDRVVRPKGATAPLPIDARVVAATGADVEAEIAAGRFRQDLFYRLAVFLIRVPPLRDRRQDIPMLVEHFSRSASQRAGRAVTFSSGAIARLRQLDWPGNVRELENVVERLVASARTPVVDASDIGVDAVAGTPAGAHPFSDMPTLDELERRYLVYALQRFAGNRTRTAAALGIDRRTLYRMSARLGVPITGADLQGASTAGN